jgi:ankyrin repeat protein
MLIAAHIQHWLSPSKALFQYEPLPTKDVFGDWLFRHHSYTSWLYSDQNDLLWITGKPGSGKSTLSKLFVDGIRAKTSAFPQHAIVAAVFFDFRCIVARKGESAKGLLLRALLYQILETDPSMLSGFRNSLNSIAPLPERPEDIDDHHYERCLRAALFTASANARVFIVIDGLDECAPAVQDDLMECIKSIYMATWFQRRVRVIITSRRVTSMRKVHEAYPTKKIYLEEENSQAIQDYSWAMLCNRLVDPTILLSSHASPAWDSLRRLAIDITHRANGTFLWVRLVIDMLLVDYPARKVLSQSMEEWHKAIQNIPTELDSLYETIVSRIPQSVRSTFQSVATWCTFAIRPLSVDELRAALRSECGHDEHVVLIESSVQNGSSYLECIGQGLIEVVYDPTSCTRRVRLIHQSAKEFLEGSGARHIMSNGAAHTHISNTCLNYALPISEANRHESPLFDYSVVNWGYHAEIGDTFGQTQDLLLGVVDSQFLDKFDSLNLKSTQPSQSQTSAPGRSKPSSVVHLAASYGLRNTILARSRQENMETNSNKNAVLETTALHRASASGHYNTVVALLDLGADVNAVDLEGRTALHLAARCKREAVCRLLIERGADVNVHDIQENTALHHAVRICGVDTVELLLEAGADPSGLDQDGNSILNLAITSGNVAVAEIALRLADTNWPSTSFGRALVFAASIGLIDLVQSILQSGCFLDSNDRFIQQALVAAIVCEHEDIVLIILGFGCHPDVHDYQHGQSALSIAAASGNERITMSLLQHGADPNLHDLGTGSTPLMHAIAHGRPAIVSILFDYGANMADPFFSYLSAGEGWLFSIVSALIRQCPNADKAAQGTECTFNPLVKDCTKAKRDNKRNSGAKRKRHRSEDSGSEHDDNRRSDQVNRKKSCTRGQWPCACPFEKMFPHQHECGPKDGVNRLK